MMAASPRGAAVAGSTTGSGGRSGVTTESFASASLATRPASPGDLPGERGGEVTPPSGEDLAQLLPERLGRGVAFARVLDQALQVRLELVVLHAVRAALEVELDLQRLGVGQLSVNVAIELVRTLFTLHVCAIWVGPLGRTIPDSRA